MNDIASLFGDHAGIVWKTLHEHGPLSEKELLGYTNLSEPQLQAAIGWLARENKIHKDKTTYSLGETNLTSDVGKDAGKIWQALHIWGEIDAVSLSRLARIEEPQVFTGVGWLAREGKVDGIIKNINEKKILFWLK
jgi:hypothetical protein